MTNTSMGLSLQDTVEFPFERASGTKPRAKEALDGGGMVQDGQGNYKGLGEEASVGRATLKDESHLRI